MNETTFELFPLLSKPHLSLMFVCQNDVITKYGFAGA